MKSFIAFLALVALVKADGDSDAFLQCAKEAQGFKQCIFRNIVNASSHNLQQLKGFGEAIQKCFQEEGVKGVCVLPTMPPHGSPPPHSFPTPPPEFASCFSGAKQAFFTCFKKEAGIPDSFKPPQGAAQQSLAQQGPPPFMQHHFAHESPEELKKKALEICNNNQAAVDKLFACAKEAVKPYLPTLIALKNPLALACKAGAACIKSNPISADCKAKLIQGRKAFCSCRPEFPKFLKESSDCAAVRAAFQAHADAHVAAAKEAESAVDGHHDVPQHPEHPFDICAENHENICKDLAEKAQKAHAAFGAAPPTS